MEKIKYALIPRFDVRMKGLVIDYEEIERQFREWIKQYTENGYVIKRETTISGTLEPGCFRRLILHEKLTFIDFAALEFQKSDKAIDYGYHITPTFFVKSKKLSKKEKKKIEKEDRGLALFEKNREEFEELINKYINNISSQRYKYNKSTVISITLRPGCIGHLFGKKKNDVDFEAYEFIKTSEPVKYKCKIFPRFKAKWSKFSCGEIEKNISSKVEAELKEGYELIGKVVFKGFIKAGCLRKGELVSIDAFIFIKV